jgi:hypothetical protein
MSKYIPSFYMNYTYFLLSSELLFYSENEFPSNFLRLFIGVYKGVSFFFPYEKLTVFLLKFVYDLLNFSLS